MRWTPNKLRSLLKESNYKLTKGYEIKKRSRLNGNMALSFLSGDEGTPSIKAVEARAYAREAAANILKARALKKELDASMNAEFIGMDDLGRNPERKGEQTSERRQSTRKRKSTGQTSRPFGSRVDTRKPKRRTRRNEPRRSKPVCECPELLGLDEIGRQNKAQARAEAKQAKKTGENRFKELSPEEQAKLVKPTTVAPTAKNLPVIQVQRASTVKDTTAKAKSDKNVVGIEKKVAAEAVRAERRAEAAAEKATQAAEEAAQEMDQPSGFFQGKNMLLIGGVAVAALAGIYFLTKKK